MLKSFLKKIEETKIIFQDKIKNLKNSSEIEIFRKEYFSRNGILDLITEDFKKLSIEDKKNVGGSLQQLKKDFLEIFNEKKKNISFKEAGFTVDENFDPFLNKGFFKKSEKHPYTEAQEEIIMFFLSLGFEIVDGPIIESAEYNFNALNIPDDHPARDEHDTFWLEEKNLLLRTHTSAVQVKEARKRKPPFGIISMGPVYRNEATDATHDFMFWQLEGLFISEDASISNLLFVFKRFFRSFFKNENLEIRVRPGMFPFVEPGMELDFECPFCLNGCNICKKTKWIEIGGTGMVHPNVMKAMDIKDKNVFGWAFGMGLTRLVMLKYDIKDIRKLHNSIFC